MPAKKTKRKKSVKRVANKSVSKDSMAGERLPVRINRLPLVTKNLVLFGILFVLSVAVALVSNNELIDNLFWILAILTGFVVAALLIVLLVIFFIRQIKK